MKNTDKRLFALTADDLMAGDLLLIPDDTPMRTVAHMLLRNQVSGAPVVDHAGKVVGVISTTDFIRSANKLDLENRRAFQEVDACLFQTKMRDANGNEIVICELPAGVCSVQHVQKDASGKEQIICRDPHGVFANWQIAILDSVPMDSVKNFMTRDVVTVEPATSIRDLARKMVDAGIHRVVVVDPNQNPLGIVSSTDILAAVSRAAHPLLSPDQKGNVQALHTTAR